MIDIMHCMAVIATVHFQRMEKINEEVVSQYGKSEGVDNAVLVLYNEPKKPKQEVCRFWDNTHLQNLTHTTAKFLSYQYCFTLFLSESHHSAKQTDILAFTRHLFSFGKEFSLVSTLPYQNNSQQVFFIYINTGGMSQPHSRGVSSQKHITCSSQFHSVGVWG